MEFRITEKYLERNLITVLNYWLGHNLHDLALLRIPITFIQAINNHYLVLYTNILLHKFYNQYDDKPMKLEVKPFTGQGRIVLDF